MALERVRVSYAVSNLAINTRRDMVLREAHERMAVELAHRISGARTTEENGDFSTTFRMEVIVATEEDFFRAVHEEAMRLSRLCPPRFGEKGGAA